MNGRGVAAVPIGRFRASDPLRVLHFVVWLPCVYLLVRTVRGVLFCVEGGITGSSRFILFLKKRFHAIPSLGSTRCIFFRFSRLPRAVQQYEPWPAVGRASRNERVRSRSRSSERRAIV